MPDTLRTRINAVLAQHYPKKLHIVTDDLRTRIAAVVAERYRNDPTNDVDGWAANLADAVIAELGLRRQTNADICLAATKHRYVTRWEDGA